MNIFIGRVAENKYYSETGYIDVIAFQLSYENGFASKIRKEFELKDIAENLLPSYSEGLRGDGLNVCHCRILSPLGAGNNYGMFCLPQVNSVGLVLQMDEENAEYWTSNDRYIWLGGLYGGKMYNENITLPNDDTDSELLEHEDIAYTDKNSKTGTEDTIYNSPYRQEGMFLVKLKTSKTDEDVENEKNQQHIHYESIPCENEFLMKKTKITLRHNDYDEDDQRLGITDFTIEKPRLQLSRFKVNEHSDEKDEKREEQVEVFDDEKIKLQFLNKDTKVDRWLSFDNDKIDLQFDDPDNKKNHTLQFNNTDNAMNFEFKDDDNKIDRQIAWNDNDLTVKFDKNGKKVVMTFDKDGNMSLETSKDCNIDISGANTVNISKNCDVKVQGNTNVKTTGNTKIESTGSCDIQGTTTTIKGTATCKINTPMAQITGGTLQVNGVAAPTGSGPFCGLPACPILGIPHAGNMVIGT